MIDTSRGLDGILELANKGSLVDHLEDIFFDEDFEEKMKYQSVGEGLDEDKP